MRIHQGTVRGIFAGIAANAAAALLPEQAAASAQPIEINDLRSSEEDHPRYLSTSIFSCSYFIRVLDDEGRSQDRMTLLTEFLRKRFGPKLIGHTLDVTSYHIFFNEAAAQLDTAMAAAAGSVGNVLVGKSRTSPKCGQDKTPHGWFDPSETTNANPPLIIEIAGRADGKPFQVRSVYSPSVELSTTGAFMTSKAKRNLSDAKAAPEVNAAIDKAHAALADSIGAFFQ